MLGLDIPYLPPQQTDAAADHRLHQILLAMPVTTREVYLLRTVDRMTVREISNRLAISRRSVHDRLATAYELLAAIR